MGRALADLTGKAFSSWTVLREADRASDRSRQWVCRCACGTERVVLQGNLTNGASRSCGCVQRAAMTRHGHARKRNQSPTFRSWSSMRGRCCNRNDPNYRNYGGRGICICDRWLCSFEDFLADMGERPAGTSLDRIDGNGNYEPGNCRWATRVEQQRNIRSNRLLTCDGETHCVAEWAEILGVRKQLILGRLKLGFTVEQALHGQKWKHRRCA